MLGTLVMTFKTTRAVYSFVRLVISMLMRATARSCTSSGIEPAAAATSGCDIVAVVAGSVAEKIAQFNPSKFHELFTSHAEHA